MANATVGNGPIAGQTLNFDFNLVNFDWVTWHDYEWENWVQVDALLQTAIGFLNIRGIWKPNTDYIIGDSVYSPEDTTELYLNGQTHTSGTDWTTDKALFWTLRTDAAPIITSVFGRIGDIVGAAGDYNGLYVSSTLTESISGTKTFNNSVIANGSAFIVTEDVAGGASSRIQIRDGATTRASFGVRPFNTDALEIRAPDLTDGSDYPAIVVDEITGHTFNLSDSSGGSFVAGRIIDDLTSMSSDNEIVTRQKGDVRYTPAALMALMVTKGLVTQGEIDAL